MSSRGKRNYYCPKCDKYLSFERVWAEDKEISDVFCKRCNSVVKFVKDSEVVEDGGILYRLSKMVAL